jgi:hypothetical protein
MEQTHAQQEEQWHEAKQRCNAAQRDGKHFLTRIANRESCIPNHPRQRMPKPEQPRVHSGVQEGSDRDSTDDRRNMYASPLFSESPDHQSGVFANHKGDVRGTPLRTALFSAFFDNAQHLFCELRPVLRRVKS